MLLALRQEISVYQLYSAGWAGMAACLAPLLLAGLLFGRNFGRALHAAAELQNKTEHEGE